MSAFDNSECETARKQYESEAKERFGETDAFKEHAKKTADYTKEKWQAVNDGFDAVFEKFAECKKNGCAENSDEAKAVVKELKAYITANYYTCTNEILAGLGQMYVSDERFKNNIDKHGEGTAVFTSAAINNFAKGI